MDMAINDFLGKTVTGLLVQPSKNGLFSDMVLCFSDTSEVQIGASSDGFLVISSVSEEDAELTVSNPIGNFSVLD